jgi:hypothetical protein
VPESLQNGSGSPSTSDDEGSSPEMQTAHG